MKKQWYTVSFSAKMTEEDVRAMKNCFYQAMEEAMEISPCVALDIELEDHQDEDEYVEIEFFGSDEGDLDAEDYVKENDIEDCEIEWDDYRKGYSLRVPAEG
jgi:hypothetical protein